MRCFIALILFAACARGGDHSALPRGTDVLEIHVGTSVVQSRPDGVVTRDGRPIMMMTNDTVTDLKHNILMTIEPDGSVAGTYSQNHPRVMPDGRVVDAKGQVVFTVDAQGWVSLLTNGKVVDHSIQIINVRPETQRSAELLVIATLIFQLVEHTSAPAT